MTQQHILELGHIGPSRRIQEERLSSKRLLHEEVYYRRLARADSRKEVYQSTLLYLVGSGCRGTLTLVAQAAGLSFSGLYSC